MKTLHTLEGLHCCLEGWRACQPQPIVGLVPTMGALHQGHLSLIERARQECDRVVVSIFVNPLQFGPQEDLARYPRSLETDLAHCAAAGVDGVFCPSVATLYGSETPDFTQITQVIPPPSLMATLCGPHRPHHFPGVATVVTKLLGLVQPDRAYFGQKDAQQLAIIRRLVADLPLPVTIVGCAIVREGDGLALSSRNQYLSASERAQAPALYRGLQAAQRAFAAGERQGAALVATVAAELATAPDLRPQYIEVVHPQTLVPLVQVDTSALLAVAAYLGQTRLIDNIHLRSRQPIIAIDGPAGAGKSTVARLVADALGLLYLDSGAMYRAVTWQVLQRAIDPQDQVAVAETLADCSIELQTPPRQGDHPSPSRVWVNGQEVTQAIRSPEVTAQVSTIAAQAAVRRLLLRQQQRYGQGGGLVMEGRDIGTHVFPEADLKIFLTASVEERARRRQRDWLQQNQAAPDLDTLAQSIRDRDYQDSTRAIAPLRQAADALPLLTDGLTIPDVVDKIVTLYQARIAP